jgi:DNA (cytosine-5)-methyltransferase 1
MQKKRTYIDLFSGAGGFSLGFDALGFENCFSIDIEPNYCATYCANFPHHHLIQDDIKNLTAEAIKNLTKGQGIDVIVGGPPCQGFSMAGNIGRKFIDDPRNQLFNEFARVVEIVQPKYFVMENVARLYTHQQGSTRLEIINLFEKMGYKVDCKVLNTADYGVPQVRNRVFFIGNKQSEIILFPEKQTSPHKTVAEAIQHLPALISNQTSDLPNHTAMKHSEQMLAKMQYISDGGTRSEIPINIRPQTGDVRKYIRYKSTQPSICITGDMRKVFHYNQNRALTVRELAAIQSFPDGFVFKGSSISQQQQVGNAVPPLMAEVIAETILKMMQADGI